MSGKDKKHELLYEGESCSVIAVRTANGRVPVLDFLGGLEKQGRKKRAKVEARLAYISKKGKVGNREILRHEGSDFTRSSRTRRGYIASSTDPGLCS